ncbi:protein FAR1-RELATED SEQUENCE 1-like [Citrus clementina]|uniref:protein FAR1-RELATED SEQUENCE 1-like n=1 Tax=Citrus clementina TaxID=85681 RepID=UPI000CED648A|nr:protein FAR1-RELATED SEQUENCE 1-like [Citrus x clementina]
MKNAVQIVFPNTKHRWCLWHILKNVPEKLGSCGGSEYEVIENDEKSREKTFKVIFEKDKGEIHYMCSMFEYKGILFKHAIAVLSRNRVQLLPKKYILRRWRKDVRRFSSKVKVSYDARSSSIEHQRYKEECTIFYDVAEVASKNEESHRNIMGWIEKVMKDVSLNVRCDGDDTTIDGGSNSNIQDPVVTRRKGRPPYQRKQKQFKRPKQKSNNVSINTTIEDAEIHDLSSQVATTIPTQESNMAMRVYVDLGSLDIEELKNCY